jgi:uncharacterized protein (DUF1015 family)
MSLIKAFNGLRPPKDKAEDVLAPPYDVLNTAEARIRAQGKPNSFLHISKPEIDLPEGTDPYDPSVYAKAAENLNRMVNDGTLVRDAQDCLYVYQIDWQGHIQTGLVAGASVADYDSNRIRKHEFTRPVKEDDRVRQIEAVNAETGPVLLAYPAQAEVDQILADVSKTEAESCTTADDGIIHSLWVIKDTTIIERLETLFEAMTAIYIADGHHRSASGSRVCASRKAAGKGAGTWDYFLSVIFPHHQMKILDYNRVISDLNGQTETSILEGIADKFSVSKEKQAVHPAHNKQFGMYINGNWYRLDINDNVVPYEDPVARLDVSLLHNNLIEPLLGISDPRTDNRIDFVGGIRGLAELEKRVDSGEMNIAFSFFATTMEDLMAVADANEVMPPKSTWFEPKLADGLVSLVLD